MIEEKLIRKIEIYFLNNSNMLLKDFYKLKREYEEEEEKIMECDKNEM